jgi:hypothetical protein
VSPQLHSKSSLAVGWHISGQPRPWGPLGTGGLWHGSTWDNDEKASQPVDKFAVALWIVTAIVLLGEIALVETARQTLDVRPGVSNFTLLWASIRVALQGASQLAALGVIIELIDQIRWNGLPHDR